MDRRSAQTHNLRRNLSKHELHPICIINRIELRNSASELGVQPLSTFVALGPSIVVGGMGWFPFRRGKAKSSRQATVASSPEWTFELSSDEGSGLVPNLFRQAKPPVALLRGGNQHKAPRRAIEGVVASVTCTLLEVQQPFASVLNLQSVLAGLPVTAKRVMAGATAGDRPLTRYISKVI